MAVHMVTYDLHRPSQDYEDLIAELKKSRNWWHYLQSSWLIESDESPSNIWARIQSSVDKDDSVLIIRVTNPHAGWLPQKAWDWINQFIG